MSEREERGGLGGAFIGGLIGVLLIALADHLAPWLQSLAGLHPASARLLSVELVTVTLVLLGVALVAAPCMPPRRGDPGRGDSAGGKS